MNNKTKYMKIPVRLFAVLASLLLISSCEQFFDPPQELAITEDLLYNDWYEYRSIEMGLYGLQQNLVEQLVILGDLRGDLMTITENADKDMIEIYNFNVSRGNKYASPVNFFKLIAASNSFIRILKEEHPEVMDLTAPVTNFDRLYGEALCMRAWTYFTAAKIYGKVPFIPESLTTIEEIMNYVGTPGLYIDSMYVEFARDGYYNTDTLYNKPDTLEKQFYELPLVIDYFAHQLETEVKAVGVNHAVESQDNTWEVTIWNPYAMHALLGEMYLTQGDLVQAEYHFGEIIDNTTPNRRYHLDNAFGSGNWGNIFTGIDYREHIFVLSFEKNNFQQHKLQVFFEPATIEPQQFMLKPSGPAIFKWETVWRFQVFAYNPADPSRTYMIFPGIPSDYMRGYGTSYLYVDNSLRIVDGDQYLEMLDLKSKGDYRSVANIMEGMDTIVLKYSLASGTYDQDANFPIYRAGNIHLYMAEVYTWWVHFVNKILRTELTLALGLVNDGSYYDEWLGRPELGIRGRVGFDITREADKININNEQFIHDPFTNEIIGYRDLTLEPDPLLAKQLLLEDHIMDERARELAFEGVRFYDLMRVAKRRGDPGYLAKAVAAKYPAHMREAIENHLMIEQNWYINYFD